MLKWVAGMVAAGVLAGCGGGSDDGGGIIPSAHASTDSFLKSLAVRQVVATDGSGVGSVSCSNDETVVGADVVAAEPPTCLVAGRWGMEWLAGAS